MRFIKVWLFAAGLGLWGPSSVQPSVLTSPSLSCASQVEEEAKDEKDEKSEKSEKKFKLLVVVNKANPIDTLTKDQVKQLFLRKDLTWERVLAKAKKKGKSGFSKSEKVRPIEFTRQKENRLFLKHVLQKDKDSLERHWIKLQYQSAIRRPKRVGTPERVLKYTSALKGCIGFINAEALTKTHKKHVKVVLELEFEI